MKKGRNKIINLIAEKINYYSSFKSKVIFGMVGGISIKPILKKLSKQNINWNKVHFYMLDERFANIQSEQSNYKQLKELLLDKIKIPQQNIHPFIYDLKNPLKKYNQGFFKNAEFFDIILLSAGEDSHIASLFPNHPSIKNNLRGFIKIKNSPKPPSERITASKKLLEKSKTAILIFAKGREQAYENFLNPCLSTEQCPAKSINPVKDKHIFTDF